MLLAYFNFLLILYQQRFVCCSINYILGYYYYHYYNYYSKC